MAGRDQSGEWLFWFSLIAVAAVHAGFVYLALTYTPEKHGAIAAQTTAISISLESSDVLEATEESNAAEEAAAGIPAEAGEELPDTTEAVEQPEPVAEETETEVTETEPELAPSPVEDEPETAEAPPEAAEAKPEAQPDPITKAEAEPVPPVENIEEPQDRTLEHAEAALERAMQAETKRREEIERQARIEREAQERREKLAREQERRERREKQRTARSSNAGAGGSGRTNSSSARVSASTGSIRNYKSLIQSRLARQWPRTGYSGKVVVVMSLTTSGNLKNVRIIRSSGNKKFDRQILFAVRRAAPFPRPPAGVSLSELSNIAVQFQDR